MKLFRQMEIFSSIVSKGNLRYDPDPISRAALPQFALVLIVLHETLARSVMIHNSDILLLIWTQNGNINLDKCFVFP